MKLQQVEKNIVIGQAYLYQGRNAPTGKVPACIKNTACGPLPAIRQERIRTLNRK
ncbi:hypothetical protein YDYSY3_47260 [Paenibacillus chitinolyticus]|uniref:hypothetical protein n=1 Tax=Paenibacillus chitinolyticus TaxID=79263 RepID=UPI0026E4B6B4|nr:hypothetical protein [Paenibacillus chitinolyticus]GKS13726.1 hypothetical protein YDYSY3_47260 [Paenibacillus chitinolyticus]